MKTLRSPFLAVAGATWLVSPAAIVLAGQAGDRASLLAGWALAGLTGAMSFAMLAYSEGRPFPVFLSSLFGGFLARLVLVALAVVWAIRHGYSPLWLCVSFFSLYWVFFACEYLALRRILRQRSDSQPLPGEALT